MKQSDLFFKIGQLETYTYNFKHDNLAIEEYIHCIVSEHLEVNHENEPIKIKVLQIHNLEEYLNDDKKNVSERILDVRKISPKINYRTI